MYEVLQRYLQGHRSFFQYRTWIWLFNISFSIISTLSQGKISSSLYPMGILSRLSFSTSVFSSDPPQAIQLCHPRSVAKAVIKTYFSLTLQRKTILALRNFCSH